MNRLTPWLTIAAIAAPLLFVSCSSSDNDKTTSAPATYGAIDGTWSFTLMPTDTSSGDPTTADNVYLYEHNGAVSGYAETFALMGTREGNDLTLNVLEQVNDVSRVQSTMHLTLSDDNTLTGAGTEVEPQIVPFTQDDSTINEKFTQLSEDWDGGMGGGFFYDVHAMRNGIAPAEKDAPQIALNNTITSISACDVIWGIDSFLISTLSDGVIRPIGNCGMEHNGGGFYLAGHVGPGSMAPIWTQTVYYPIEWSWCKTRTYHFRITLEGPVTAYELASWIHDHYNSRMQDVYGLAEDAFYQGMTDFYNTYGGFAVCAGYSTRTHNTSIYLLSDTHQSKQVFMNNPATAAAYHAIYDNSPGQVWVFTGSDIHDFWVLRRDITGACGTPVLYMYVIGTNKVNFN